MGHFLHKVEHSSEDCAADATILHKVVQGMWVCAMRDTFLHKVVQCAELVRKRGELFIFALWEMSLQIMGLW